MEELVANLHIHTKYSDGTATHNQIVRIAQQTGIDVIMITDHNVNVRGFDGYYYQDGKKVLMLVGEEIHDRSRLPASSHLLTIGTDEEWSFWGHDLQKIVNTFHANGGFTVIAHPFEMSIPWANEPDISWRDWQIEGVQGYELWNGFSEFKDRINSPLSAIFYAYFPFLYPLSPPQRNVEKWDELISNGNRLIAVGGSDAHALKLKLGPLKATVFPYRFHFLSINTHILTPRPLSGNLDADREMIMTALRCGHAFIGYDRPASTRGFRFSAYGKNEIAEMGDEIILKSGVTFQIRLPEKVDCRLIRNGSVVKTWQRQNYCTYITNQPGAYRVEAYIPYFGKSRGWIFSNPIYVTLPEKP